MQGSVLGEELRRETSVAATANAAGTSPFLNTPPRGSCSRQVRGSLKEVDQESKWVSVSTERSRVTVLRTRLPVRRPLSQAPLRPLSGSARDRGRNRFQAIDQQE